MSLFQKVICVFCLLSWSLNPAFATSPQRSELSFQLMNAQQELMWRTDIIEWEWSRQHWLIAVMDGVCFYLFCRGFFLVCLTRDLLSLHHDSAQFLCEHREPTVDTDAPWFWCACLHTRMCTLQAITSLYLDRAFSCLEGTESRRKCRIMYCSTFCR